MFTKSFIIVSLLLAAVILVADAAPSVSKEVEIPTKLYIGNNLIVGKVVDRSQILAQQYVYEEAREGIFSSTVTITTSAEITLLTVLEERNDLFVSAFPVLVSGGPGFRSATVRLTSWFDSPISFTITAYGRR